MDGFHDFGEIEYGLTRTSALVPPSAAFAHGAPGGAPAIDLIERRLETHQALVVTKLAAGLDDACVDGLRQIVDEVASGARGRLKFLVLDFAHPLQRDSLGGDGFARLVNDVANLILRAPVVSIACARADLSGADLELALSCSMMVGEAGRRFCFAADPIVSVATYGFLSQKIGFVLAEQLMERGESLDAEQMRELLLVKSVLERGAGFGGIERFLTHAGRRHNSSYGIYRAQRIATPALADMQSEAWVA